MTAGGGPRPQVAQVLADVHRQHWSRLVALLATSLRRLDLAEDALQDAVEAATRRWPVDGVPDNPPAWLLTAARRRAIDRLRSESAARRRLPRLALDARTTAPAPDPATVVPQTLDPEVDEQLAMLFACCHPALSSRAQVPLMLRFCSGLAVPEIARLLLLPDATVAARLTRAKRKVAEAAIPIAVPPPSRWADRLDAVLAAVYLTFTEGYAPARGSAVVRTDLAAEAVRLGGTLLAARPEEIRPRALLALMLLQHSRRHARVDADGRLVPLPEQDRRRWLRDEIDRALDLLQDVPDDDEPYALQARIAAEHARATTSADTDWHAIAQAYARLERVTRSPVVRLNRAVAVAEAAGPAAGLALLHDLDEHLPNSHRLHVVRGELLLRAGQAAEALCALDQALALDPPDPERAHLNRRRAVAAQQAGRTRTA